VNGRPPDSWSNNHNQSSSQIYRAPYKRNQQEMQRRHKELKDQASSCPRMHSVIITADSGGETCSALKIRNPNDDMPSIKRCVQKCSAGESQGAAEERDLPIVIIMS